MKTVNLFKNQLSIHINYVSKVKIKNAGRKERESAWFERVAALKLVYP